MRRTPLLALGVLLLFAGCDSLFGPSVGPPAEVAMSSLPQSVEAGTTITGITATVHDRDGKAVQGAAIEWVTAAGTTSPASGTTNAEGVTSTSWTVGTSTGSQSLRASVGGVEGLTVTRATSVTPGPLARMVVTPAFVDFESVGDTVMLSAEGTDEYGNSVDAQPITWTSSAPSVASVQDGRVISQARGTAGITAAHDGVSETVPVVVDQVMAALKITPSIPVMAPDETMALQALPVDARGSTIDTTLATSWASSEPGVATVDQSGVVTALETGTTVIAAHAADHSAEFTLEVRPGARPTITGITPAVLSPGDTATITGTGFSTTSSENQVTVAGHAAQVISAASTQLVVAVPTPGTFPCGPTTTGEVVVSVDGFVTSVDHPLAGAAQHALAVGESVSLLGSSVACNELAAGGTYLLSVFNTTNSPTAQSGFRLRGTAPAAAMDVTAMARRQQHWIRPSAHRPERDREAEAHTWLLEENARVARELFTPRPGHAADGRALMASVATDDTRAFRIPDLDSSGSLCTNYLPVTARAVFVGENAVIWEDEATALAGEMDARWQQVGQEYESVMHPIILQYFGDPLAYDASLQNPGRVHMLFSDKVNRFERGVNGFVFSGDFVPTTSCTQSNQASLFYGRAPTVSGSGYTGNTVDSWAWSMRATIIHEVKHLASYATRFQMATEESRNPVFEVTWLEEATARLAEEHYGRALMGYGQGDNVTYDESIWCERRVGSNFPQCDPVPNVIHKHFSGIYGYYRNVEGLSPLGPAVQGDGTYYGSGWLLVRWAIDHTGMSEQAFSRALVHEASRTGVANLSARTGRSFPDMLADFTLAMMTDDHPSGVTVARPELTFPSWNTRDIMQGLYDDYQGSSGADFFNVPWPLSSQSLGFGNFDADVSSIRGGTATFFQLTGPTTGRQLLELLSSGGATAPPNIGMAIVRVN